MVDPVNRKGASGPSAVSPESSPDAAGEAFRGAVDGAKATGSESAGRAAALQALAAEVRAGRMDTATAVDKNSERVTAARVGAQKDPSRMSVDVIQQKGKGGTGPYEKRWPRPRRPHTMT